MATEVASNFTLDELTLVATHTMYGYGDGENLAKATKGRDALNSDYGRLYRWYEETVDELAKPPRTRKRTTRALLEDLGYFAGKKQALYEAAVWRGYRMGKFMADAGYPIPS